MKTLFITIALSALFLAVNQANAASGYLFWKEQIPSDVSKSVGTISVGNGGASWFLQEIVQTNFPQAGQETASTTASAATLMVSSHGSQNWFFRAIAPNKYAPRADTQFAQRVADGK